MADPFALDDQGDSKPVEIWDEVGHEERVERRRFGFQEQPDRIWGVLMSIRPAVLGIVDFPRDRCKH